MVVDTSFPSPCVPHPLPLKPMFILDPQVFLLLKTTMIRGWGIYSISTEFKMNEIDVDKSKHFRQVCQLLLSLIVTRRDIILIKANILDKCVNYFRP